MKNTHVDLICVFLSIFIGIGEAVDVYTNHFHVHLKEGGGLEDAHRIAKRHGFINRGQVAASDNEYHFVQPALVHARTRRSAGHHAKLHNDDEVRNHGLL